MGRPIVLLHALKLHEGALAVPNGNFYHMANLVGPLYQHCSRAGIDLRILVDELSRDEIGRLVPAECLVVGRVGCNALAADWLVAKWATVIRPDVYHRPTGQIPIFPLRCQTISGVADLNFKWLKVGWIKRYYKDVTYRRSFRRSNIVVCVSGFTRQDVLSRYDVDPRKVKVIHHGTPRLGDRLTPVVGVKNFWMAFGHQKHKNVEVCLRALTRRPYCEQLVVIGVGHYVDNVLKPAAKQLGVLDRVMFLGRIRADELCWLYRNANGLLFTSKFEGFGLPVLEAMGMGCPVICSNAASLPEVAGDAAILVEADDAEATFVAMNKLVGDSDYRERLAASGLARAASFSWDEASRKTVRLYMSLLANFSHKAQ